MLNMAKMSNAQAKIIKPSAIKTKNMRLQRKRMEKVRSKLHLLKHISKRNCALLPYLDDESLHTLGEFIYNIIHQKVKLDNLQEKKVKAIIKKDRDFYQKLIAENTKDPLGYFRKSLKFNLKSEMELYP